MIDTSRVESSGGGYQPSHSNFPNIDAYQTHAQALTSYARQYCAYFGWNPDEIIDVTDEKTNITTKMSRLEIAEKMVTEMEMTAYRYMKKVFEASRERRKEYFSESKE